MSAREPRIARVSVALSTDEVATLDRLAASLGVSRSDILRLGIRRLAAGESLRPFIRALEAGE